MRYRCRGCGKAAGETRGNARRYLLVRSIAGIVATLFTVPMLGAAVAGGGAAVVVGTVTPVVDEAKAPPSGASAARPAVPARPAPVPSPSSSSSSSSSAAPVVIGASAANSGSGEEGEGGDAQADARAASEDTRVYDAAGVWSSNESLARDVAAAAALYERDTGHPVYVLTAEEVLPAEERVYNSEPENMPTEAVEEARDFIDSELALAGAPEDARAIAIFPESEAMVIGGGVAPDAGTLYSSSMRERTESYHYSEALEAGLEQAAEASSGNEGSGNGEGGSAPSVDAPYMVSFATEEQEVGMPSISWKPLAVAGIALLALVGALGTAAMRLK